MNELPDGILAVFLALCALFLLGLRRPRPPKADPDPFDYDDAGYDDAGDSDHDQAEIRRPM